MVLVVEGLIVGKFEGLCEGDRVDGETEGNSVGVPQKKKTES